MTQEIFALIVSHRYTNLVLLGHSIVQAFFVKALSTQSLQVGMQCSTLYGCHLEHNGT